MNNNTSNLSNNVTIEEEAWEMIIDDEGAGERLDKLLAEALEEESVSRTQIQDWIRAGHVQVGGRTVKPNYKVAAEDRIVVTPPPLESAELTPQDIPLEVVYEDGDVIVVNKPRGMVVHPAVGHPDGTLVNALMHHCKDLAGIGGELRPGIVHRIDKDTTGLLMAAKNDLAHHALAEQLKAHTVTRKYIALVHGNLPHDHGTIDAPIGRDPQDRKLFKVTDRGGKDAVTHFAVLERLGDFTLVELKLETGRTHQIRVHMKYIGYPLAGDPVYGRNKTIALPGQALHAAVLGFEHPRTGAYHEYEAPLPADFVRELEIIRQS